MLSIVLPLYRVMWGWWMVRYQHDQWTSGKFISVKIVSILMKNNNKPCYFYLHMTIYFLSLRLYFCRQPFVRNSIGIHHVILPSLSIQRNQCHWRNQCQRSLLLSMNVWKRRWSLLELHGRLDSQLKYFDGRNHPGKVWWIMQF